MDGRCPGFDGRVHTAERGHAVYTNFSGWALGGSANLPPSFDNRVVATTPIALQAGKQVRSVTLPSSVTGGTFQVFSIGVA